MLNKLGDGIKRKLRRGVDICRQPLDVAEIAFLDFARAPPDERKIFVIQNFLLHLRRIDANYISSHLQQQLTGASRCAADLSTNIARLDRDPRPQQRFFQFEISPTVSFGRGIKQRHASRPTLGNGIGKVIAVPPLVRLNHHDVKNIIIGLGNAVNHQRTRRAR